MCCSTFATAFSSISGPVVTPASAPSPTLSLATAATSFAANNPEGGHFATDFGGGMRFYPKEWLALEFGLLATLYPDKPDSSPTSLQTALVGTVGVSFFFPPHFEYVYP